MAIFSKRPAPGTVRALFLHIQKTAGTSIVHLARQYYGESITSHGDCWGKTLDQLTNMRFISGHIGYHFARPLMDGRYTFTFLRDPAERILSMYYFCQTRDPAEFEIYRKAHELNLAGFLKAGLSDPCVRMNIWNNQVWQLAYGYANLDNRKVDDFSDTELLRLARIHIDELSYVGFTETFVADATLILRALGIPESKEIPVMNATPDRPRVAEQSPEIRNLLDRLTALDRSLYDHARTKYAVSERNRDRAWWRW